jgi:hypothetical protein
MDLALLLGVITSCALATAAIDWTLDNRWKKPGCDNS